jgi:ribosomal protein S18 acetylase RimI-like enzyme
VRFQNSSLAGASGLHPAQRRRAFFSVVVREHNVPQRQNGEGRDNVNQQKAPHNAPLDAHGTSGVADEARGNRLNFRAVKAGMISLWKSAAKQFCWERGGFGLIAPSYNGLVPFIIRDFQASDFDTLWNIDQTCFPAGISYSRAELRLYMRRRASFTLVAANQESGESNGSPSAAKRDKGLPGAGLLDAAVAGFIITEAGARARGHIITIDVIPSARRAGVGSLLLRAAEDRLISVECRSVELETAVDNFSAIAFYKRHGFSVIKTFPRYYSNGVDALVLEKTLV